MSASEFLARLADWGFSPDVQQRIGAFIIAWGIFEVRLEMALWALNGETVAGVRPSTDRKPVSMWLEELDKPWPQFSVELSHPGRDDVGPTCYNETT